MTKKQEQKPQIISASGTTIYLTNKELLKAIQHAKGVGYMTDVLARMLQLLCARYAKKGNFVNYSYNEDMQSYAMMMLVRTWNSFNPEKSNNPFAFFTQCIKNSFIQYLNQEKRQRNVRDLMLIDQGLNPSFGFAETESRGNTEDEEDFDIILSTANTLKNAKYEEDFVGQDVEAPVSNDSAIEQSDSDPLKF